MSSVHGTCPTCRCGSLVFDYGGIVSGPGVWPYPEVCELLSKDCDCVLSDEQIEAARMHIVEDPEAYFGRVED